MYPRRHRYRRVGLLAVVGALGCSPGPDSLETVVRDSSGIRIVENTVLRPEAGDVWRVAEAPFLDLGAVDGPPAYQFEFIAGATRLDDGGVIVADAGADELRAYDATGSHVWSTGRDGEGPGEFRNIGWVRRLGADSVMVYDRSLRRVSTFDVNGGFGRVTRLAAPGGAFRPGAVGVFSDASMLVLASVTVRPTPSTGIQRESAIVMLYASDGSVADSIFAGVGSEWYMASSRILLPRAFGRLLVVEAFADRIYVGDSEEYDVRVYTSVGSLISLVRLARPRSVVSQEDIGRWEEQRIERTSGTDQQRVIRSLADEMPFPDTFPVFQRFVADHVGNLWVEQYRRVGQEATRFDVFDPYGRYLGMVTGPNGLRIFEIGDDYVLGRWSDDLDVHHVRVHALIK